LNVLLLAGGDTPQGSTPEDYPLWLSEVSGSSTILERQVRSFDVLNPERFVFAFRKQDVAAFHVDQITKLIAPGSRLVEIGSETKGAACTALLAIDEVDPAAELIVMGLNDVIDCDLAQVVSSFREEGLDAGAIVFESIHPRYSFMRLDRDGRVTEVAEKRPISRNASAGFYWFRRAEHFFRSVQKMILKDAEVNGRFFIAPAINELILSGQQIGTHRILPVHYHPVKAISHVNALEHAWEGRNRYLE
jgi:hypothetical protein